MTYKEILATCCKHLEELISKSLNVPNNFNKSENQEPARPGPDRAGPGRGPPGPWVLEAPHRPPIGPPIGPPGIPGETPRDPRDPPWEPPKKIEKTSKKKYI